MYSLEAASFLDLLSHRIRGSSWGLARRRLAEAQADCKTAEQRGRWTLCSSGTVGGGPWAGGEGRRVHVAMAR